MMGIINFGRLFLLILILWSGVFASSPFENRLGSGNGVADEDIVKITALTAFDGVAPGKVYAGALLLHLADGWHINSSRPFEDYLIAAVLEIDTLDGIVPLSITYPIGETAYLGDQKMSVYNDSTVIYFAFKITDSLSSGPATLPLRFTCQPCNNNECRAPRTLTAEVNLVVGREGPPQNQSIFTGYDVPADISEADAERPAAAPSELERLINNYGFWGYFLALGLAFITGLLLSFSPCTYPMIPITVSVFAGQKRSIGRGFILSLFYVGSMAVMYGIMGLIVSLVGGVFGSWLASPAVVIGIAVVFVIFSLSMFGLYELSPPANMRQKLGTKGGGSGVMSVIILGIVAALVVSPCVGPFVAGILLYVATYGSPTFGFLTLFIFALGLGTLYIIIATFSSAINSMPRSGEWMEEIKRFFGFVLLFMAVYFLRTVISPQLTAVLTGLILLGLAVFWGGLDRLRPEDKFFPRLKKFIGILALLVSAYLLIGSLLTSGFILPPMGQGITPSTNAGYGREESPIDWYTDLNEALEAARLAEKPVLIDTWATWCANCKVLDEKTFRHPDVVGEAEKFVAVKVQLEKSDSPESLSFMKRFGMKHYSLPTTMILKSDGTVVRILQGVVAPDDMLAAMREAY